MKISVVITTYNEEENIKECLNSLMNQVKKADEIILVDDGSEDKTVEIASKHAIKIVELKHSERSKARNIGWQKAGGDILLFAEADSIFHENWILEIRKQFKDNKVTAVIDRRKMYKPRTFFQKTMEAQFDIRYAHYKPFSAWAFRREVLEKVEGFDEKLNQSEDSDLGKRILKAGYKIVLAKNAIQYHRGEPQNFIQYLKRAYYSEKRKMSGYYKKYPKEKPKFVFLELITLLIMLSIDIKLFILCFFLYFVFIFSKIVFIENGWKVVAKNYLIALSFYRIFRRLISKLGFVSGYIKSL